MAALARFAPSSPEEEVLSHVGTAKVDSPIREELFELVRSRSFRTGSFKLSSGEVSNVYFNMKQTMMHPKGAELTARAFLLAMGGLDVDFVSGLEMGAVPAIGSIAALSSALGQPVKTTFVRKRAKEHGTQDVIEGLGPTETLDGAQVLVIDDVSTTGKSILQAIEEVRRVGGIVNHAACIVNRAEGGDELLAKHGVELISIFHVDEFVGRH